MAAGAAAAASKGIPLCVCAWQHGCGPHLLAQRWHPAVPHSQAQGGACGHGCCGLGCQTPPCSSGSSSSLTSSSSSSSSGSVLVLDDGMAGGEGAHLREEEEEAPRSCHHGCIQLHAPSPHPDKEP